MTGKAMASSLKSLNMLRLRTNDFLNRNIAPVTVMSTDTHDHEVIAGGQCWNFEIRLIQSDKSGRQSQEGYACRLITNADTDRESCVGRPRRRSCSRRPRATGLHGSTTCQVRYNHLAHMGGGAG